MGLQISNIVVDYLVASDHCYTYPLSFESKTTHITMSHIAVETHDTYKMKRYKMRARFRTFKQHPTNLSIFEKRKKAKQRFWNEHII